MRILTAAILGGIVLATGTAGAQSHDHSPGPSQAGPGQPHLEVQRFWEQFERTVADGRGFGMAFVADRNGYPGPLHVLELGEALKLSAKQEAHVRTLRDAMFAESRPKSAALLDAESRLRRLFENRTATEPAVRAQVTEVERLRSEVRLIHLLYHLKTRDLLTEPQRAIYHEKRWTSGG